MSGTKSSCIASYYSYHVVPIDDHVLCSGLHLFLESSSANENRSQITSAHDDWPFSYYVATISKVLHHVISMVLNVSGIARTLYGNHSV